MNIQNIKKALAEDNFLLARVEVYVNHLLYLQAAKNKDGTLKNPWMKYKKDDELITYFKKVAIDGLDFDGVHITLTSVGISYDYIAYKNKMYLVYPETTFDLSLVYKDDSFKFQKNSGKVIYQHEINNPFNQDEKNIIGAYAVIINKRGQFLTLLSKENIDKCRKIARTDYIWSSWYHPMALKTITKTACKQHFQDIYQNIDTLDNENVDLDLPLNVDIEDKAKIEVIETIEKLKEYYNKHKGRNAGVLKSFNKLISNRKAEIEEVEKKVEENMQKQEKPKDEREPGMEG